MKTTMKVLLASAVFAGALGTLHETKASSWEEPEPPKYQLDEGYTFFKVLDHIGFDNKKKVNVWDGYSMLFDVRVFGEIPGGSVLELIYKDGKKEVARQRCEGQKLQFNRDPAWQGNTFSCDNRDLRIKVIGALSVELNLIDGNTDEVFPLRTLTLNVHEAENNGRPPVHYISRQQEALSSFIVTYPADLRTGYVRGHIPVDGMNMVALVFNVSGNPDTTSISGASTRLRCKVNGEFIELKGQNTLRDMTDRSMGVAQTLPGTGSGPAFFTNEIWSRQIHVALPLSYSTEIRKGHVNYTDISEHPGLWECDLRHNAETFRSFSFTVNHSGFISEHPEQANNGLFLSPYGRFVEMTIPDKGLPGESTSPKEVQAGGFYGRAWATDAMKKAKVPSLGTPHLVRPGGRR